MFVIDEKTQQIKITRGDSSGQVKITLTTLSGDPYEYQAGDSLVFCVAKDEYSEKVISKQAEWADDGYVFTLKPEDTKSLQYGSYKYDYQLETSSEDVYTPTWLKEFVVAGEVS